MDSFLTDPQVYIADPFFRLKQDIVKVAICITMPGAPYSSIPEC